MAKVTDAVLVRRAIGMAIGKDNLKEAAKRAGLKKKDGLKGAAKRAGLEEDSAVSDAPKKPTKKQNTDYGTECKNCGHLWETTNRKPTKCPHCGSTDVEVDEILSSDSAASDAESCYSCGATKELKKDKYNGEMYCPKHQTKHGKDAAFTKGFGSGIKKVMKDVGGRPDFLRLAQKAISTSSKVDDLEERFPEGGEKVDKARQDYALALNAIRESLGFASNDAAGKEMS
jgi:predicted Zn-ribbon and HTH transcriptional regulator